MNLRNFFRNGVSRMQEGLQIFRKNVFELQGVPAFLQFYQLYMWPWKYVYRGYFDAWHKVPVHAISSAGCQKDKNGLPVRTMATMNAGKMACSQLARYVWGEKCDITVTMNGNENTDEDMLNDYIHYVLKENSFNTAFGEIAEKSFALGGAAIKEWADVPKDENGNDAGMAEIRLSFHMADQFIPTSWNNHQVKEGLFVSREAKDGWYYSTVEWHKRDGSDYVVTNEVYRQRISESSEPQNILGWWYPLNAVYPLLSPETRFSKIDHAMFQYIRPFGANFVDDNSPLGVSVYASAMDTLHSLDIAFDGLRREFVLGRKRIIVPARCIRMVRDQNGVMRRYFDPTDEVYEAFATDDTDGLKIIDNTVELRVEEHVAAINSLLSILCEQIGFDAGTLSFDLASGMKTATEVISQNSKTYSAVQNHQNNFRDALENMVDSIIELSIYYDISFKGIKISDMVKNGYSKSVKFDDGIIQDKDSNIDRGIKLVGAGLMSKYKMMVDTLGYTPEEAEAEIQRIAEESQVTGAIIDRFEMASAE